MADTATRAAIALEPCEIAEVAARLKMKSVVDESMQGSRGVFNEKIESFVDEAVDAIRKAS